MRAVGGRWCDCSRIPLLSRTLEFQPKLKSIKMRDWSQVDQRKVQAQKTTTCVPLALVLPTQLLIDW